MKPKTTAALLATLSLLLAPALFAEKSAEKTSSDHAADADNSARNQRDRQSENPTPLTQGKSEADVSTTKQIRQQIVADKDLSVNAHNVKIITQNGRVTLRGPVKTAEEKQAIGEIANKIATSGSVDNQLEVKASSDGM